MNRHATITVSVGSQMAEIDEEIAPLIEEIWKAGIITINSCQENRPGTVWIEFLTTHCAAEFLNAIAEYSLDLDSLYNRLRQGFWSPDHEEAGLWEYSVVPWDTSVKPRVIDEGEDGVDEVPEGDPCFEFHLSVRFPKNDIPVLLERMRAFNESERGAEYRAERGV